MDDGCNSLVGVPQSHIRLRALSRRSRIPAHAPPTAMISQNISDLTLNFADPSFVDDALESGRALVAEATPVEATALDEDCDEVECISFRLFV